VIKPNQAGFAYLAHRRLSHLVHQSPVDRFHDLVRGAAGPVPADGIAPETSETPLIQAPWPECATLGSELSKKEGHRSGSPWTLDRAGSG
jgi:hypothetical protein